jgi:hypothetical protein
VAAAEVYSESATGSKAPTIDGSITGGQRNPVCVAGKSNGEVARPPTAENIDPSGHYLSRIEHISELKEGRFKGHMVIEIPILYIAS